MWKVEGNDQACRVVRTGQDCSFATLCGQTSERGHWWVRNIFMGRCEPHNIYLGGRF